MRWISNSPTVTIELNAGIRSFTKKNNNLLVLFIAGWVRYALQNNYSKDPVRGSMAGIRCSANVYKAGGLETDREMQKLIGLDVRGGAGEMGDGYPGKEIKYWGESQVLVMNPNRPSPGGSPCQ
jgi:hypothetical protein